MEADVLNALKSRVAYLSGGRDHDSNLLIIFQLPYELQPWTKRYIEVSTKYLLSSLRWVICRPHAVHFHRFAFCSQQTLNNGLIAIVDAQKCSWRLARDQMKLITQILDKNLIKLFAIRTEAFSMQNCAKTYKKGEVRRLNVFREIGFECYAFASRGRNWINSIDLIELNTADRTILAQPSVPLMQQISVDFHAYQMNTMLRDFLGLPIRFHAII